MRDELEEPLSRIVKALKDWRWAQPRSQWIVFGAGESPGQEADSVCSPATSLRRCYVSSSHSLGSVSLSAKWQW